MNIIELSKENIADEHICCAFSDKKCNNGTLAKKNYISNQLELGYKFKKFDIRGKVFIEYLPAEFAWVPIEAENCMHINCFWVSGQYQGKGYGKALLEECLRDSAEMNGITAVASKKKMPFLNDGKYLEKHGFEAVDTAPPYFVLYFKPLKANAPLPRFAEVCRFEPYIESKGLVCYYSPACPFTEYYVNSELTRIAQAKEIPLTIIQIDSFKAAQNHLVPFTIYSLFYEGKFITHQILSEKLFDKFLKI